MLIRCNHQYGQSVLTYFLLIKTTVFTYWLRDVPVVKLIFKSSTKDCIQNPDKEVLCTVQNISVRIHVII